MKIVETVTTLRNKQVVLRNYVTGFPKESLDMKIVETITTLKLPKDPNEVLLKNLYLSYDAYMQILMTKDRLVQVGPYALGRDMVWLKF
ncbi:NADP-dependent alkenal double bond reductase P1 [Glycine soja]|uniref:NADP-dependent alkenal double bond reductase P1 n=1 Tax=Glycine soja TaxID=3848 RepID=A0A0B2QKJ8_GLYSO|nr:NADP-dependent alkenal double bond reductase P1 [Glycine soja]